MRNNPFMGVSLARKLMQRLLSGGAGVTYDVFVNSAAANDLGNGLTLATAKKTLSAAMALVTTGKKLGLVAGSSWREAITPPSNMTIGVVGSGAAPILDQADVATGWTRPDAATFPNVWSISWTRTGPITGSDDLGVWIDGVRPRVANTITDLNTNGGWFSDDYRALTSNVYVHSTTDPNSNGKVYEVTRRNSGINWHPQTSSPGTYAVDVTGPLEIKRAVGHYNAVAGGTGSVKKVLMRDGHIHHGVFSAALVQDCIATEARAGASGIPFTAYQADGTGFNPVHKSNHALFDGGANRELDVAFYAHSSLGNTMTDSYTVDGCTSRGRSGVSAATLALTVKNHYAEDPHTYGIDLTAATCTVDNCFIHDTTASPLGGGAVGIRKSASSSANHTVNNTVIRIMGGVGINGSSSGRTTYNNCSIRAGSNGINSGIFTLNKCIIHADARALSFIDTGYVGDYNVFFPFPGQGEPWFHHNVNGLTTYDSISNWRTWTGQDTNSVYVKEADQTSGNPLAFWLGVANGTGGPEVGDWRVNPNCRVYGDGGDLPDTSYIGTFRDGTAITVAGAQKYYDYNTKSVVNSAPYRRPTLPTTITQMRSLLAGTYTF